MVQKRLWTDDEMIVVLDLYFKLPFGKQGKTTPEVQEIAKLIGRTDSAVAMRLGNYAACDPYILSTGRHGLSRGGGACKIVFEKYYKDKATLSIKAKEIREKLIGVNRARCLQKEDER